MLLIIPAGFAQPIKKTPMQKVGNGAYCWTPDGKIAFYRLIDYWIKMEPDPFPGGGGVYDDYEKNDEAFIVVRDPQTKEEKVLFKLPYKGAAGRVNFMDWSPAINKILLSTGALEVMTPDGKEFKDITPENTICGQGVWSPDGNKILYSAGPIPGQEKAGAKRGLYIMNADGTNNHLLVENGMSGSWSSDGKQIAYQTAGRRATEEDFKKLGVKYLYSTQDVYIINADGTGKRMLVEGGANPRWSPDGKWILCGGKLLTPKGEKVNDIRVPGTFTRWSPDMKYLLSYEGIIQVFIVEKGK
ncbi:MAG: PD40 domain-containing protein [Candidatus Omnitrophica bacterium]|nr:PD40 domain-containing protein [Candidatus Omnitrophota bacterium]